MLGLARRLSQSALLCDLAVVFSASTLSYIIALLATPVITRLYSPAEFGVFYSIISIVALVSSFANLRYDLAIPPADDDIKGFCLLLASVATCLILGLAAALAIWLCMGQGWFGLDQYPSWTPLVVFVLVQFINLFMTLQSWLVRQLQYRIMSRMTVLNMLVRVATQISLGFANFGLVGLITSELTGRTASNWLAMQRSLGRFRACCSCLSKALVNETLSASKSFPKLVAPASTLNKMGSDLIAPFVLAIFGVETAGFYALAALVASVPVTVIGQSTSNVYAGYLAQAIRSGNGQELRLFLTTGLCLMGVSVPIYGFLFLFGQDLFDLVFGNQWREAGKIVSLLAVLAMFQLAVGPLEQTWVLINQQKFKLIFDGIMFAVLISAFAAGQWLTLTFQTTLWLFVIGRIMALTLLVAVLYVALKYRKIRLGVDRSDSGDPLL